MLLVTGGNLHDFALPGLSGILLPLGGDDCSRVYLLAVLIFAGRSVQL